MGSYLEIDRRETNSKTLSGILIDAIRNIDGSIMVDPNSTKKQRNYFVAENYNTDKDGNVFGVGDWVIHRKGMALLVQYLQAMQQDDDVIEHLAIEYDAYFFQHENDAQKIAQRLAECIQQTENNIQWCLDYCVTILTDMVINKKKTVEATWI